jgi:hypothetical protein
MAFYRKKITYDIISPLIQDFKNYVRDCGILVKEAGENNQEVFLLNKESLDIIHTKYKNQYALLLSSDMVLIAPVDNDNFLLYFLPDAEGPIPTVSITHIRIPKLSYLITLVPEDFFLLFRILSSAKLSPSKNALSINLPALGISQLTETNIGQFFVLLRTNYRIVPHFADKKWTSYEIIHKIATLAPTRDSQLSAMQYLTAAQNADLLYFPAETAILLELDNVVEFPNTPYVSATNIN